MFNRKVILMFLLGAASANAVAEDIAQCSNPKGKSYYPYMGYIQKKDSGWTDDAITGGITTLVKTGKDEFDILFVDSSKRIVSSTQDGGIVRMLNRGANEVSFFVIYPGKTLEIYTFLIDKSGKPEYISVTSRAGDQVSITKSTVMRGDCQFINFNALN